MTARRRLLDDAPRLSALKILDDLDNRQVTLDAAMERVLGDRSFADRRDRALLQSLVYGVLRWRGRLDWIIDAFVRTRLEKVDPQILNILRIGLFQIAYLDRVPASAAVNTSVEMTRAVSKPWAAKFVNALLRRAVREHQAVRLPDPQDHPATALSVVHAMPRWLIERWLARWGISETRRLCEAVNAIPALTVRTNTLKIDRPKLICALADHAQDLQPTPFSDIGVHVAGLKRSLARLEAFETGWFRVQDEAAQLATWFMDPRPGERILDACAGRGGKTGHIAQCLDRRGEIDAWDQHPLKLEELHRQMKQLGAPGVATRVRDLNRPLPTGRVKAFDRILLDAPCSGLGVLRRNPDAKWRVRPADLVRHQQRQIRFLKHLAPLVKPGGVLVYAVCSTEPEENEAVVAAFLNACRQYTPTGPPGGFPPALTTAGGFFRSHPHRHGMDGFFAARFRHDG